MSSQNDEFQQSGSPVLIVGAGVAGLQTARALLKRGLKVLVIEQSEDVGGVWIRNYQGYGLQVPWEMYQFPEFPYPRKSELQQYPSGEAVREYVQAYARHFGLYRHILFGCRLISLRRKTHQQQSRVQQQQHLPVAAAACSAAAKGNAHRGESSSTSCEREKNSSNSNTGDGYWIPVADAPADFGSDGGYTPPQPDERTITKPPLPITSPPPSSPGTAPTASITTAHSSQPHSPQEPQPPTTPPRASRGLNALLNPTPRLRALMSLLPSIQPDNKSRGVRTGSRSTTSRSALAASTPCPHNTTTAKVIAAGHTGTSANTCAGNGAASATALKRCGVTTQEVMCNMLPGTSLHATLPVPAAPAGSDALSVAVTGDAGAEREACTAGVVQGGGYEEQGGCGGGGGAQVRRMTRVSAHGTEPAVVKAAAVALKVLPDYPTSLAPSATGRLDLSTWSALQDGDGPRVSGEGGAKATAAPRPQLEQVQLQQQLQPQPAGHVRSQPAVHVQSQPGSSKRGSRQQHRRWRWKWRREKQPGGQSCSNGRGLINGGEWEVEYEDSTTGRRYKLEVSYCVLCTGLYATPFIPSIPGQELYRGLQVHSRDFTDASVAAGKLVLVVGAGKTALDIVTELTATQQAARLTLLYRRPHWPLPRFVGPVAIKKLAYTRLASSVLLPYYYDAGPAARAATTCLTPLRKAFWIRFMSQVDRSMGVRKTLGSLDRPICQDIWYSGQVLDALKWPEVIANPKVKVLQGEVARFTPVSAVLQDGTELDVDVVLYATGYSSHYTFLEPDVRAALDVQHDGLYLYRHCLAPGVEGLAFVGAEVTTFNNILTSGLQAEWLAAALCGELVLPRQADMAADVAVQRTWRRRHMPPHKLRGSAVMLYMQCYHDQLLKDMGLTTHRKHPSLRHPLAECWEPYTAHDYLDVFQRHPSTGPLSPRGSTGTSATVKESVAYCPSFVSESPEAMNLYKDRASAAAAAVATADKYRVCDTTCFITNATLAASAAAVASVTVYGDAVPAAPHTGICIGGSPLRSFPLPAADSPPSNLVPYIPGDVVHGGRGGSALTSTVADLRPPADVGLGASPSAGADCAMMSDVSRDAGVAAIASGRTHLARVWAAAPPLAGVTTARACESAPLRLVSGATTVYSTPRGGGGNICQTSEAPAGVSQPLFRAIFTSSTAAATTAAAATTVATDSGAFHLEMVASGLSGYMHFRGTLGGGGGSGSSPAWRPPGPVGQSLAPMATRLLDVAESVTSAALDEQDTLYSLDALPPALQTYHRPRERMATSLQECTAAPPPPCLPPAPVPTGAASPLPTVGASALHLEDDYLGGTTAAPTSPVVRSLWFTPRTPPVGGVQGSCSTSTLPRRLSISALYREPTAVGLGTEGTSSCNPAAMATGNCSTCSHPGAATTTFTTTTNTTATNTTTTTTTAVRIAGARVATAASHRRSSGSFLGHRRLVAKPSTCGNVDGASSSIPSASGGSPTAAAMLMASPGQVTAAAAAAANTAAMWFPTDMLASKFQSSVMARASQGSAYSFGGDSGGGSSTVVSGGGLVNSPRRTLRGLSLGLGALLQRSRNIPAQVTSGASRNDVTNSRMEPSSVAVSALAYKALPPRHVEEALAAAAIKQSNGNGRLAEVPRIITAPPSSPPLVPAMAAPTVTQLMPTSSAVATAAAPPPAASRSPTATNATITPQKAQQHKGRRVEPSSPGVATPPPDCSSLRRRSPLPLSTTSRHRCRRTVKRSRSGFPGTPAVAASAETVIPPDGDAQLHLLLPNPPPHPPLQSAETDTTSAEASAVFPCTIAACSHLTPGRPSLIASASGISYLPSSSALSFPCWGDSGEPGSISGRAMSGLERCVEALGDSVTADAAEGLGNGGGGGGFLWAVAPGPDAASGRGEAARYSLDSLPTLIGSSGVSYVPTCSTVVAHHWQ